MIIHNKFLIEGNKILQNYRAAYIRDVICAKCVHWRCTISGYYMCNLGKFLITLYDGVCDEITIKNKK